MSTNVNLTPEFPGYGKIYEYLKSGLSMLMRKPFATFVMLFQTLAIVAFMVSPFALIHMALFEASITNISASVFLILDVALISALLCSGPVWMIVMMNHLRYMDVGTRIPTIWEDIEACKVVYKQFATRGFVLVTLGLLLFQILVSMSVGISTTEGYLEKIGFMSLSSNEQDIRIFTKAMVLAFDFGFTAFLLPTIGIYIFYMMKFNADGGGFLKTWRDNERGGGYPISHFFRWAIFVIFLQSFVSTDNLRLAYSDLYWLAPLISLIIALCYSVIFYVLSVEMIEGRKLKAKVKENVFDGEPEAV